MCRLPTLLRYFRVSPNASYTELRQAYLQRVKTVHPDLSAKDANVKEFQAVQNNFEEAAELIRQRDAHTNDGSTAKAYPSSWADNRGREAKAQTYKKADYEPPEAHGVPSTGLSSQPVYFAAAGIVTAAVVSFMLSSRSSSSSTVKKESEKASKSSSQEARVDKISDIEEISWPALQGGPWSVGAAKADAAETKTVWAPSKAWEFQDSDSFYQQRAKGHMRPNIGQRKAIGTKQGMQVKDLGYEASHEPQVKDDVVILPVHEAAASGQVWWLESCGATVQCRGLLTAEDSLGNTPLHHSAKSGHGPATKALLRLGVDAAAKNKLDESPEDLAVTGGHTEIVDLLQKVSETEAKNAEAISRHPDGYGVHTEPPESIVFTGLTNSGVMRRALNMAAGCIVTPPLPVTQSDSVSVERLVNVARGALGSTEFEIQDLSSPEGSSTGAFTSLDLWQTLEKQCKDTKLCGLLIYEAPSQVTEDAAGHWIAVRKIPASAEGEATDGFFRLDPIRGPFQVTTAELAALLGRYRTWGVVRQGIDMLKAKSAQNVTHSRAAGRQNLA